MTERLCLLISPALPDPRGSGLQQRAFYLLRDLASEYKVLLLLAGESFDTPSSEVSRLTSHIVFLPTRPLAAWKRRAALLVPLLLYVSPSWAAHWPQLSHDAAFSVPQNTERIVFFRIRAHGIRPGLMGLTAATPLSMDVDDIESATHASIGLRALRRGMLWLGVQHLALAWQYAILERTVLRRYSEVFFASSADRNVLERLCSPERLTYRPNRVRPAQTRQRHNPSSVFTFLLVGTLNYFPNHDAALWLASEIVPRLRQHMAVPFRIIIAGRHASRSLIAKLATVPEVCFLGPVNKVDPLYRQAHVALVAVRCGGGTKVKLLEAVAFGCPVVSTSHSGLGLPFQKNAEILVGDTAEEIALCCARLHDDPQLALGMAESAYARLTGSSFNADRVEVESTSTPSCSE